MQELNDKVELRAAAARLLYADNRDSADYDLLIDYINKSTLVRQARWDINCDGYYPYCTYCNYEPPRGLWGSSLPQFCPGCGAELTNYKEFQDGKEDKSAQTC